MQIQQQQKKIKIIETMTTTMTILMIRFSYRVDRDATICEWLQGERGYPLSLSVDVNRTIRYCTYSFVRWRPQITFTYTQPVVFTHKIE